MARENTSGSPEDKYGSFPIPLHERTWGPWLAGSICATAAIASWSFVLGGYSASFVDAKAGTATLIAGALVAQMFVSLAQLPPTTIYGLETASTTKPQLGVRGSYIAVGAQVAVLIGWNLVLLIFFGRAAASALTSLKVIGEAHSGVISVVVSVGGALLVWWLLTMGSKALKYVGPAIAIMICGIAFWMLIVLFSSYSLTEIESAEPLSPTNGGPLINYTIALELMMASTIAWWPYMGGILRMVSSASKATIPSMVSLGFGWAVISLISLYSALVTGEWDPTVWMIKLGGVGAGTAALVFIALANIGSTLVGVHAATLGIGQIPFLSERINKWGSMVGLIVVPMLLILIFFPAPFYDNIGIFLAFAAAVIAPLVGEQIVDWFVLRRINSLHIPSLYKHHNSSAYWYTNGFNPAGVGGLVIGAIVYIVLINPVTFMPRSEVFQYTTATLPALITGGFAYWGLSVVYSKIVDVRESSVNIDTS